MTLSLSLSAPARFALVMDGLKQAVAAKIRDYPWTGPMVVYVWNRLHRINQVFQALAALIAAGTLPPERPCRRRSPGVLSVVRVAPDPGKPKPAWTSFSFRFAWLCAATPSLANRFGAAQFGSQLRHLLADPEMMSLIAASSRMRRTLRPLLWMLGIEASLIRPPSPAPVGETAAAGVAQETTDQVVVTAPLVCPSDPPDGEVPEGQVPYPDAFARA
jgi:hypothetical protein